jgi:hypothetical protein
MKQAFVDHSYLSELCVSVVNPRIRVHAPLFSCITIIHGSMFPVKRNPARRHTLLRPDKPLCERDLQLPTDDCELHLGHRGHRADGTADER